MALTFAQGSRAELRHKLQSAFGTTATGNYLKLPFTTHSLDMKTAAVVDPTIRADREIQDMRHTTRENDGDINVALRYADHDFLIASAMFSQWGSTDIGIGVSPQFLSIEDAALDIGEYRLFKDMLVNRAVIRMAPAAIVQATFGLVGTGMTRFAATQAGVAPQPASGNKPFDSLTGQIYDDNNVSSGSALGNVTGLDLTIDNTAKAFFAIGSRNAAQIESGPGAVSGQVTAAYKDNLFTSRYINETEFALSFSLTDPDGHGYNFRMPRVKVSGEAIPVGNPQTRIATIPFHALKPTSGSLTTALTITKF